MDSRRTVRVEVVPGDVLTAEADVLVLKYAQQFYGADRAVAAILRESTTGSLDLTPPVGEYRLIPTYGALWVPQVLFVGVRSLFDFRYAEIREFAVRALHTLADTMVSAGTIAFTLHGPGYGLDETECFLSEIAGIAEAVTAGRCPGDLETVQIIERSVNRATRLSDLLEQYLPGAAIERDAQRLHRRIGRERSETLRAVGYDSGAKEHVFVAMPFAEEMGDLFHYGIRQAVNATGYLCERIDEIPSVGDVLPKIKELIKTAAFVVAELTGASPNVYLEVGYAWGCGVPTILLIQHNEVGNLKFDVAGQRCVVYSTIRDLESRLATELRGLATT